VRWDVRLDLDAADRVFPKLCSWVSPPARHCSHSSVRSLRPPASQPNSDQATLLTRCPHAAVAGDAYARSRLK